MYILRTELNARLYSIIMLQISTVYLSTDSTITLLSLYKKRVVNTAENDYCLTLYRFYLSVELGVTSVYWHSSKVFVMSVKESTCSNSGYIHSFHF